MARQIGSKEIVVNGQTVTVSVFAPPGRIFPPPDHLSDEPDSKVPPPGIRVHFGVKLRFAIGMVLVLCLVILFLVRR